jgi:hypothetical protein
MKYEKFANNAAREPVQVQSASGFLHVFLIKNPKLLECPKNGILSKSLVPDRYL